MIPKLKCKYSDFVLAPSNALSPGIVGEYETADGVVCTVEPISAMNNIGGIFDKSLDDFCEKHYNCEFATIKSIWFARLGELDDFWHVVKLIKK